MKRTRTSRAKVSKVSRGKGWSDDERKKALKEAYSNTESGAFGDWYLLSDDELSEMGLGRYVPSGGDCFVAILPRTEDPVFFKEIFVHYDMGVDKSAYLCPNKMFHKNCPICNYAKELENAGEDREVVRQYWPVRRFLFWVVDVESEETIDKGVCIYDAPKAILDGIKGVTTDKRTGEIIDISDPVEHLNLVFTRQGKGIATRYVEFGTEERKFDFPESFYDLPPMDDILVEPDVEKMNACLGVGAVSVDRSDGEMVYDDDEEEEEIFKPKSTGRRVEKRSVEDESDDEIEEEDDEQEVKTKIRRRLGSLRRRKS